MVIACVDETIAKDIYNIIGTKMSFPSEKEEGIVPFEYLGIVKDYNGVGIQQISHYTEMNCQNYIQRLNRTHGWDPQDKTSPSDDEPTTSAASVDISVNENVPNLLTKPEQLKDSLLSNYSQNQIVPVLSNSIEKMYKEPDTKEGSPAHKALEVKMGFTYCTLLGELIYTYITCCPDIGYTITTLFKFSCAPGIYHYKLLQMVAKYLQVTAHWSICFKRSKPLTLSLKMITSEDSFSLLVMISLMIVLSRNSLMLIPTLTS